MIVCGIAVDDEVTHGTRPSQVYKVKSGDESSFFQFSKTHLNLFLFSLLLLYIVDFSLNLTSHNLY